MGTQRITGYWGSTMDRPVWTAIPLNLNFLIAFIETLVECNVTAERLAQLITRPKLLVQLE
jgi:hypothetical protein